MTPAEMRGQARWHRSEARRLDKEAAAAEATAAIEARLAANRAAVEALAAAGCQPVWRSEPGLLHGRPLVVKGIERGVFRVGPPGEDVRHDRLYSVRSGWCDGRIELGRLEPTATLEAWRAWCASRRAQ